MRRAAVVVAILALLGVTWVVVDRDQPLVRNSLVYARAAWNVIDHGYDPRPVVADSKLSYDKPIGFAWLAAPFVARLGAHVGLRVVSCLGAIAYLLAVWCLAATLLPVRLRARGIAALITLAAFGPIVAYQAWSAHPDSWFAALAIVTLALIHRIATGEEVAVPRRSLLLAATLLVAFLLKNYALILLPSCALYLLAHLRQLRRERRSIARRLWWCGGMLAGVAAFAVAAKYGRNPLSRLEGEGGGADQFALPEIGSIWWKTLAQAGVALALQFHVTGLALLRRGAWSRTVVLAVLCFGVPYVAGLLPFPTAFYNMRYFQPLFPLVALAIVAGADELRPAERTLGTVIFLAANLVTTLVFNVPALFDAAKPLVPEAQVEWLAHGPPLSLLDNLRMGQHREQAAWLAAIDQNVEPGAVLYMVDVVYYRDAEQQVFERDGFIRRDITTRYVNRKELQPTERRFYVWSFTATPLALERLGAVTDLGHRLFRIEMPP